MLWKNEIRAALAICAAIVGAGFASGREIVTFFSDMGSASWLGVLASSAAIGAFVYVILILAAYGKADSFPELYGRIMGGSCKDAIHVLHGLLCLLTASAMLAAGSELGGLAFSWKNSHLTGFLLTLCAAIASALMGMNALSAMGAALVPFVIIYYLLIAAGGKSSAEFSAQGLFAAMPMGLLYASFNAALAGGTICQIAQKKTSPGRTGIMTGILMLLMLSCANLALLRAGSKARSALLPSVILSAQWGVSGYYASIVLMWISLLSTLCAMLSSLRTQLMSAGMKRTSALFISAASASLMSVVGFKEIISIAYPLLGWTCAFVLIALVLFLPGSNEKTEETP